MANTPFRNLVLQGLQPLVLPYAQKEKPSKGWHLKKLMTLEEADQNDLLLSENKINLAVALAPHLVAVDVDVIDPDVVDELFGKIQHSPCRKLGSKGFTCIYRADGSSHKSFALPDLARQAISEPKAKIEFLAGNHYTILPPSIHPDTQAPYQWLLDDQELLLENLPVFDRASFTALLTELDIPTDNWGIINAPAKRRGGQIGNRNAAEVKDSAPSEQVLVPVYMQGAFQEDPTVEDLAKLCLSHIPADCTYDEWAKVGLAINHSITGERGAALFREWSRTATKEYPEADITKKCVDIFYSNVPTTGRQLTFAHLEYRARQHPQFALTLTPEQLTALAIINNSIAAQRYDIGDLETAVETIEQYPLPEECRTLPLHSDKVQAEITRQILGINIVATEQTILCYSSKVRRWQDAKKYGTGPIIDAEMKAMNYIQTHPRFTDAFIKADGTMSEAKLQTALMAFGSAARTSSVRNLILGRPDLLTQKKITDFDSNNEMLALNDGSKVCLRTGNVSPIEASDYIRKTANYSIADKGEYGNAPSILMDAFSENKDPAAMHKFFQRLGGYCLSGDISLQKIFCFLGGSNNGKTFFVNHLRDLLGQFSTTVSSKLIMADKKGYEVDLDRARASIVGLRLAAVTDTKPTAVFNEEIFKGITDAKLSFRRLYEETAECDNHSKLIICCNDVPSLGSWDAAMQRRFVCVPFCKTYSGDKSKDVQLLEEMHNGMPGLLRWFVDGRIAMLEDNNDLCIPSEVLEGTEEQVFLGDPVSLAVKLACTNPSSQTFVTNDEIAKCLTQWAHSADERFKSGVDFAALQNAMMIAKRLRPMGFKGNLLRIDGVKKRGWYMDLIYPEFKVQQNLIRDMLSDLVN